MARKLSVAVLTAALLMSGGLVGVSFGNRATITEPQVIELKIDPCSVRCRFYPLVDGDDHQTGQVTLSRNPVFDADGAKVGTFDFSCHVSDRPRGGAATGFLCTNVLTLQGGAHTEAGTIVEVGLFVDGENDVFPIVGGSGAYENVGGYAVQGDTAAGPGLNYTLHLVP
jgi:hypothetical protein